MKRFVGFAMGLGLLVAPLSPTTRGLVHADEPTSTSRHVHGIITGVDDAHLTIASMQSAVSGKLDPKRTRVTINGKPGKVADLKLTAHAKAELCLDDVWLVVDAH